MLTPIGSTRQNSIESIAPQGASRTEAPSAAPKSGYGSPAIPDANFASELAMLVGRKSESLPQVREQTRKALEAMMTVKGRENLEKLTPVWQSNVEKSLGTFPESIRDHARYAMTDAIMKNIPEAKKAG
ncbi:MAG: hypothetical protein V2A66_09920 [Pseudomonadota bacterium]